MDCIKIDAANLVILNFLRLWKIICVLRFGLEYGCLIYVGADFFSIVWLVGSLVIELLDR